MSSHTTTAGWSCGTTTSPSEAITSMQTFATAIVNRMHTSPRKDHFRTYSKTSGRWSGSRSLPRSSWWRSSKNAVASRYEFLPICYFDRFRFSLQCNYNSSRWWLQCDQYWPSRGSETYGDTTVMLMDVQDLATYCIRTFQVSMEGVKDPREVKQFQFTAWPDHGVPDHPTPFLMFLRRVHVVNPPEAGPMVIHCRFVPSPFPLLYSLFISYCIIMYLIIVTKYNQFIK